MKLSTVFNNMSYGTQRDVYTVSSFLPFSVVMTMFGPYVSLITGISLIAAYISLSQSKKKFIREYDEKREDLLSLMELDLKELDRDDKIEFIATRGKAVKIFNELCQQMDIKDCALEFNHKHTGAASSARIVLLNEKYLTTMNDEELRYILAHELSHIKSKDDKNYILDRLPLKASFITLFACMGATVGLGIAVTDVFITPLIISAYLLKSKKTRLKEFRADKTAVQITKNADAAASAVKKFDVMTRTPKILQRAFQTIHTHPVGYWRAKHLYKSAGQPMPPKF